MYKKKGGEDMEKENESLIRHHEITNELWKTYKDKNSDYGDAFGESLDKFGLVAGVVRIGDKFNRLATLYNKEGEKKVDESLRDTLLDMANYCIMSAMWLDKKKDGDVPVVPYIYSRDASDIHDIGLVTSRVTLKGE